MASDEGYVAWAERSKAGVGSGKREGRAVDRIIYKIIRMPCEIISDYL